MKDTAKAFAALLLSVSAATLLRTGAQEQAIAADAYESLYVVPPPGYLRALSLGHDEALADLLWCRALVYLGEEFAHGGEVDDVFGYTEAMLTLDPEFLAVYRWIANAAVYQPQGVTAEEVERSIAILERGRQRFPQDGQLAWLLGATLSYELPPLLPPERRADARLRGVPHLMDAARLGAAPAWLVLSNASQLQRLGDADRAVAYLEEVYDTVSDEQVRLEIAQRIREVRTEAYGEAFLEANDRMESARFREFSYVSPDFWFLLAPEPGWERTATAREGYGHALIDELTPLVDDE